MAIHLHDVGTVFELTLKDQDGAVVNLALASAIQMVFRKPDESPLVVTAVPLTSGTDGKMIYTAVSGDLDQVGPWQAQGLVTIGAGYWHTDRFDFLVLPNVD